jgi:tetratricopeptide (TPR) repeat protein
LNELIVFITEIPFVPHEDNPNLVLRAEVVAIENIEEFISQGRTQSKEKDTVEKIWSDALAAYHDFDTQGNLQSLDLGISNLEAAVEMTPESSPRLPVILINLGSFLCRRFEQLGRVEDINNSIERFKMAVGLTPDEDPEKHAYFNNLGNALQYRFDRFGDLSDLDSAIAQRQSAVNLIPDGHPHKSMYLNNIGGSLHSRFERLGNLYDVDNAITQHQLAVNLTPDGHPNKSGYLTNLGVALHTRSERLDNLSDLDNAITQKQLAVHITPDGHLNKPAYLTNLGVSFHRRFEQLGNLSDLDNAITQQQSAIKLTPNEHPNKLRYSNNLGISLHRRFERLGILSDLDGAITQFQLTINLSPDGHPGKPGWLNNLGNALCRRFERLGNLPDIYSAITQNRIAVSLTPDGHPLKSSRLYVLGSAFESYFLRCRREIAAEEAITHFAAAAQSSVGPPTMRLKSAQSWISLSSLIKHHTLMAAYECAIGLMPLVAWLGLPMADRHGHLVQIGEIARDGAAAAISLEQYDKALEWLEQGRSIVWNQILQLRTPVDELREVNSDLSDRLLQVSRLLDRGLGGEGGLEATERDAQRYRALTMEWESILKEIRSLPNFEDFLKPLRVSKLRNVAQNGPVVVVNIAKERCDALVLIAEMEDVIHIPLPDITFNRVSELREELKNLLYSSGIRSRGERAAQKWADEESSNDCTPVLAALWNGLVKPVLDWLAFPVRSAYS